MDHSPIIYRRRGMIVPVSVLRTYPDGMPLIDHMPQFAPERLLLRPSDMQQFVAALFYVDALVERGAKPPELILPCVPGARQDRLNERGDVLFTAKSVAAMINARHFPRVTVIDPHSDVIAALIDRCHVEHVSPLTFEAERYVGVIAPDGGVEKRAGRIARALRLPLVHAWKSRDVATGDISGFGVEPLERSGRYLIVDDLCDGGGTFVGLASLLAGFGVTADLFVTHGVFSRGTHPLTSQFDRVYCTDSIVGEKSGVNVIHLCDVLLRAT